MRNTAADSVDDGTWRDLEFERLFASVDSTLTRLGSQCLYHKLRIYRDDPGALQKDYAAYQVLRRDTALREQLQLGLWPLRSDSDALTCESLFGEPAANPSSTGLVLLMSGAGIMSEAELHQLSRAPEFPAGRARTRTKNPHRTRRSRAPSDPTIQQLPSLLGRADREKAPKRRDSSSRMLGKVILEFPQSELVRVIRFSAGLDTFNPRSWMALVRLLFAVAGSRLRGSS